VLHAGALTRLGQVKGLSNVGFGVKTDVSMWIRGSASAEPATALLDPTLFFILARFQVTFLQTIGGQTSETGVIWLLPSLRATELLNRAL
jgi:hypothetical protein